MTTPAEEALRAVGPHLDHGEHRQAGSCTYCACGARLYQGKPWTEAERAAARVAIDRLRPGPAAEGDPLAELPLPEAAHGDATLGAMIRDLRTHPAPVACKAGICAAPIHWAVTEGNKPMPFDDASVGEPGGNLAVWRWHLGSRVFCRVLKAGEEPARTEVWATNHWGTCPARQDFKP